MKTAAHTTLREARDTPDKTVDDASSDVATQTIINNLYAM